jgi:hypothetical protein
VKGKPRTPDGVKKVNIANSAPVEGSILKRLDFDLAGLSSVKPNFGGRIAVAVNGRMSKLSFGGCDVLGHTNPVFPQVVGSAGPPCAIVAAMFLHWSRRLYRWVTLFPSCLSVSLAPARILISVAPFLAFHD